MSRPKPAIIIKETHALVPLKNNTFALIDLEDVVRVSQYGWVLDDTKRNMYVHTCIRNQHRSQTVKLHNYILNNPPHTIVDHINSNGLDNRKQNLRICTPSQNGGNRRKLKAKTSIYKGVHKRDNGKWRAAIRVNGKLINLGTFVLEIDAAKAYNVAALLYFKEFACLNQLQY